MDPAIEPDFQDETGGFTLIELLVCIAILSVLAFGASLALPRGSAAADRDMALFQRQYTVLRQRAITRQVTAGLAVDASGMRQARRQLNDQQQPNWQLSPQQLRWQGQVVFADLGRLTSRAADRPQIQFLADGRSSAFVIRFSQRGGGRQASCRSDGWTGLTCSRS